MGYGNQKTEGVKEMKMKTKKCGETESEIKDDGRESGEEQ